MSEEIKEILDIIKKCSEMYEDNEHWKILLDYITNLQEKVDQYENPEDYTLFYMWLDEKAKDKMKELQEKNTKLKKLCNKYEEEHKTTFIEWQKDIKANKKAIEYIEKYVSYYDMEGDLRDRLLNILVGSDKE